MRQRCPACKRLPQRSTVANARYWALLGVIEREVAVDGRHFAADPVWHRYFRRELLGCVDVVDPMTGEVAAVPRSTTELDIAEFNDYMTKVEAWAAERGAFLDEIPNAT